MSKFNVGDRVVCGGPEKLWKGVRGYVVDRGTRSKEFVYVRIDPTSNYADGTPVLENYRNSDEGIGFYASSLMLDVDTQELTELRKFKEEAIAKYPDLAPMSEEDKFVEQCAKEWRANTRHGVTVETAIRTGIKWGREHAN